MNKHTGVHSIAEVQALASPEGVVRIPPELNVPVSRRVSRLLDAPAMRRLSRISQLGLVNLVYPGANHSRLEHSLGVYRNALLFLHRLSATARFNDLVDARGGKRFLLAALLHDIGHWPFCHPIEDMRLPQAMHHEKRATQLIHDPVIADCISREWDLHPDDITNLLSGNLNDDQDRVLASLLSGPIDVDKMDYLVRDSLHAGVPYGRNFDLGRLIGSLTIHPLKASLAITDKGRTAAEMMVFSRYIMFSEVYWHHTVRSATAMLQRAIYLLADRVDLSSMFDLTEAPFIDQLLQGSKQTAAEPLVEGLFGNKRTLHKQVAQFSILDAPAIHRQLAGRPYEQLVRCGELFSELVAKRIGMEIEPHEILIDAPPQKLEVDINVDVISSDGKVRTLGDVSPVAAVLSKQQFDNYVKRVRIFVTKRLRDVLAALDVEEFLLQAANNR
ncbi:MAG: HD domain-containing protein [Pirellulaceae bacterium]